MRVSTVLIAALVLAGAASTQTANAQQQPQTLTTTWSCAPSTSGGNQVLNCTAQPIIIQWPTGSSLTAVGNANSLTLGNNSVFSCSPTAVAAGTANSYDLSANCVNKPASTSFSWTGNASPVSSAAENPTVVALAQSTYTLNACEAGTGICAPLSSVNFGPVAVTAPTGCSVTGAPGTNIFSGSSVSAGQSILLRATCAGNASGTSYTWSSNTGQTGSGQTSPAFIPFAAGTTTPASVTYSVSACNGTACFPNALTFTVNRATVTPPSSGIYSACNAGYTSATLTRVGNSTLNIPVSAGSHHVIAVTVPVGKRVWLSYASIGQPGDFELAISNTQACVFDNTSVGWSFVFAGGNTIQTYVASVPPQAPFSGLVALNAGTWYFTFKGPSNTGQGTAQMSAAIF